jgi:hypothetical protein
MPSQHPSDLRERVFEFACAVVVFSRALSQEPGVNREIAWQLAAAATSVGSNLDPRGRRHPNALSSEFSVLRS